MCPMLIDGISTNEHIDSSGEVLNVAGHDISDLVEGKGVLNWEHSGDDPEDTVGAIVFAKKIFRPEDCDDDRQRMYWDACKKPFVYIVGELFDDDMHPGSVAVAAMIRYYARRKEKMLVGFSIEGSTLKRDGNVLERSVGRKVAITLKPCNKSCLAGLVSDPVIERMVRKAAGSGRIHQVEVESIILSDDFVAQIEDDVAQLKKALTAGGTGAAPSQLTQGSALQREELTGKKKGLSRWDQNRIKSKLRDWNRSRPLAEYLKAELPDISHGYLDHFAGVVQELSIKKGEKPPFRVDPSVHTTNKLQSDAQSKLIDGIYPEMAKPLGLPKLGDRDVFSGKVKRTRNDHGQTVVIKAPRLDRTHGREAAENAELYHHLAHKVFRLGDHVPVTNYFHVPGSGSGEARLYQAMEYLPDHKMPLVHEGDPSIRDAMSRARHDGTLHKLAVLDYVTGADSDRHGANYLVSPEGSIKHVDNDELFDYDSSPHQTFLHDEESADDPFPEHVARWLSGVDPNKLVSEMHRRGVPHRFASEAKRRLEAAQQVAERGGTIWDMKVSRPKPHHLEEP